jgi:hypothetical protein
MTPIQVLGSCWEVPTLIRPTRAGCRYRLLRRRVCLVSGVRRSRFHRRYATAGVLPKWWAAR